MNTLPNTLRLASLAPLALLVCAASGCSSAQHADVQHADVKRNSIALVDAPVAPRLAPRVAPAAASRADAIGHKIVLAARGQVGTSYTQEYFDLKYPDGDPPKNVGACTDVIVRALRGAGFDLQQLMHEDMKRHFSLYPRKWGLRRTDTNIDHRRVPNQRVFFQRFAKVLGTSVDANAWSSWRPGDVVQWKLQGEIDHTGIVSDQRAASGRPLVIHNLGGCVEEDALSAWKIVGHFRFPKR